MDLDPSWRSTLIYTLVNTTPALQHNNKIESNITASPVRQSLFAFPNSRFLRSTHAETRSLSYLGQKGALICYASSLQ